MEPLDLADLADSWQTHLEAERKAANTVRLYLLGVRGFLRWCDQQAAWPSRPGHGQRPCCGAAEGRAEPATAKARHQALRRFAEWLVAEGELPEDPLVGLKAPKVDVKVVPILADSQLRALIRACQGMSLMAPPRRGAGAAAG
jgi:site-specific recombinase XerD